MVVQGGESVEMDEVRDHQIFRGSAPNHPREDLAQYEQTILSLQVEWVVVGVSFCSALQQWCVHSQLVFLGPTIFLS